MLSSSGRRISQRAPKACQECTRRKVRCDKTVPCSRCRRLKKACSREDVVTTKSTARNAGSDSEVAFLLRLQRILSGDDDGRIADAQALVEERLSEASAGNAVGNIPVDASKEALPSTSMAVRALESQIWSRQSTSCYPHRGGCNCAQYGGYAELVSINCDMSSPSIQWISVFVDPVLYLTTSDARKVVEFHISHLWWHHNALHASTFLDQCNIFWNTNQTTLWTLANSPAHRQRLGIDFSESIIPKQFEELMRILYTENFLSKPSMYSIQSIVISTRYAHNIGFSDSVTNLLASAVGIAQAMGLHRIDRSKGDNEKLLNTPYEKVECENGKRIWWQLVIQDYFSIPFTESYCESIASDQASSVDPPEVITRKHFTTPIPMNCNDDLLEQPENAITISAYTRCVAQECLLMPEVFDGFLSDVDDHRRVYRHVCAMGNRMKALIASFPKPFLGNDSSSSAASDIAWLATARRTLAISVSDKIIMLHRPLLLHAFRTSDFSDVRQTCLSAALTILRENDKAACAVEETLSVWTQSAFCTTAVVVLVLELMYGSAGADSKHEEYILQLQRTSERLEKRRCDAMAAKCAKLIRALIVAHGDLTACELLLSAQDRVQMADQIIQDQRLLSQVISVVAPENEPFTNKTPSLWPFYNDDTQEQEQFGFDFNAWYSEMFAQFS
ncbi:serine carboxypeptidase [Cordyceps javanica]|uniref:Serine carboxypeptidase n=1 Tax=Cordyceps javanica TaxID=43265 RepID=A0A545UQ51_9HYPO|nr:serine carboxypeptidase [Cordyceps javanica]TQW03624.1 serine carboxypeptidase [Cordyceps javanica]